MRNLIEEYSWSDGDRKHVVPYGVERRLKEDMCSIIVSRYSVARQELSPRATPITVVMSEGLLARTFELCQFPTDHLLPWRQKNFSH